LADTLWRAEQTGRFAVTTGLARQSAEALEDVGDEQVRLDFAGTCERVVGVTCRRMSPTRTTTRNHGSPRIASPEDGAPLTKLQALADELGFWRATTDSYEIELDRRQNAAADAAIEPAKVVLNRMG
jgi:hypothetical protein